HVLRNGRPRQHASAPFAGEWDEGGAGKAFSTANQRFAPLKMPFLPRMSPKMIENERAAALSNSPKDFFNRLNRRLFAVPSFFQRDMYHIHSIRVIRPFSL
ncbi:MAG: hypothetical protein PUK79_04440, partial [Clostridiales bacterium]|nr:hypothetical protein [Clostridiales bacterium]